MPSHLPKSMIAYRRTMSTTIPVAETIDVPSPALNEVLIKVLASGVCHSDISLLSPNSPLDLASLGAKSITLGHEGAGVIVALGSSVASTHPGLDVGTYVAIHAIISCQGSGPPLCTNCSRGFPNICGGRMYGLALDGSWAPYAVVNASSVIPIPGGPDRVSPAVASSATDAVLTPYHAMKTCCRVLPEHTVLCMGIGGLGLNAVEIAKKLLGVGCVVACDTRDLVLDNARAAGADYAVTPDKLSALVAEKKLLIDFAFDFVGSQKAFDTCIAAVAMGGTIHTVGFDTPTIVTPLLLRLAKELTLKSSSYGTKEELGEVLKAIADGVLQPKVETRPLSECAQVLEEMHQGKLKCRVALVPDSYLEPIVQASS